MKDELPPGRREGGRTRRAIQAMLAPAILPAYATTAMRILRRWLIGARRYPGDAISICRAIVEVRQALGELVSAAP